MTEERLRELLSPFLAGAEIPYMPESLFEKLLVYLDLLVRWNGRTNLTAIRDPEEMVRRHFGESLFAAVRLRAHLPAGATVLDLGSGAGFPGLPIQLFYPSVAVTLAESQGKKAAFLREAVRVLGLSTEVWPSRVESMSEERRFVVVTLRAVDRMAAAIAAGSARLQVGGVLAELASETSTVREISGPGRTLTLAALPERVPGSERRVLRLWSLGEAVFHVEHSRLQ